MVRRILVLGVSGVGKSTACSKAVSANPSLLHLRASRLLCEATGQTADALRLSSSDDVESNQQLLAVALDRKVAMLQHTTVLLDGHAVIDNDRTLIRISTRAVEALKPNGILLVEASPAVILQRRASDRRRRPLRTIEDLEQEIKAERDAVFGYRQALDVPLEIVWAEPTARLEPQLSALLRNSPGG